MDGNSNLVEPGPITVDTHLEMTTGTANSYLRDAVMTASAEQLQLMLYDGAIRFSRQGRDALIAENFEESYDKLSRAQAIVSEMESGLRHEVNPELCSRMAALYSFIYRKLVEAGLRHEPAHIDDALKVLHLERETWVMLIDRIAAERANPALAQQSAPVDPPSEGGLCVDG